MEIITQSLPVTLWIIAVTVVMGLIVAVPLALYVAMTRRSSVPYIFRATTSVFLAIPAFFTALIGLIVFGLHYGVAPIIGYEPGFPGEPEVPVASGPGDLHDPRAGARPCPAQLDSGNHG